MLVTSNYLNMVEIDFICFWEQPEQFITIHVVPVARSRIITSGKISSGRPTHKEKVKFTPERTWTQLMVHYYLAWTRRYESLKKCLTYVKGVTSGIRRVVQPVYTRRVIVSVPLSDIWEMVLYLIVGRSLIGGTPTITSTKCSNIWCDHFR